MQADGYSLDDKRTPQPDKSDLADILARWQKRDAEGGINETRWQLWPMRLPAWTRWRLC